MNEELFDIAVIGGGFGGIYSSYRFREAGLSVVGIEGGSGFGGVWHHNCYPGARVDTYSVDYCYHFSQEIYEKWRWDEKFASQPDLMRYIYWVADQLDVAPLFRFDTWLREANWSSADNRWHLVTDKGDRIASRFVTMCTGILSEPKPIPFAGLDRFKGDWYRTSRWPHHEVDLAGKRVGLVGTGSTGVQVVPVVAEVAEHLYVFQRKPHYSVPAQNGPTPDGLQDSIARELQAEREHQMARPLLSRGVDPPQPLANFTPEQQQQMLEAQWLRGGHGIKFVFSDIPTSWETNKVVADFVRDKIRKTVNDPVVAEKLCPDYPIGSLRIGVDIGFYESFNRDNVTLVSVRDDPIVEITETGLRTEGNHYELDTLIFALGFKPFLGAINAAGVKNEKGQSPSDVWARGPRNIWGLMTPGFPNFFHPTNAGAPSVSGPLILQNELHADWIAEAIAHMDGSGYATIEATEEGADRWGAKSAALAENLIRRQVDNYMVHVNDDGTRIFMPWEGGMATYAPEFHAMASVYDGVTFG